jgi:hypothetical protein
MSKLTLIHDTQTGISYVTKIEGDHYVWSFPTSDEDMITIARGMVSSYNFMLGTDLDEIKRMGTFETYKIYRDAQYEGIASMFTDVVEDSRTQANLLSRIARWRRIIHWNDYDGYIFKDLVDLEQYLTEKGIRIADFPPKSE